MNESVLGQIKDLLTQNDSIGIVVGKNPSVDAMGSALALYLSLKNSGKNTVIVSATTPLVEHSSLIGIDKVKGSFEGEGGDLVVSFPYKEGEIDKVSYTLEEGFLNIIVKPGELGLNFSENDVIFRRKGIYPSVIITVGVPKLSDLSSILDVNELKNSQIINIDNSMENQSFGEVLVLDTQSSSLSEQIEWIISGLGLDIDIDVAQNLLSALSFATNNFQDPNTTPSAFAIAASLMEKGAVRRFQAQRRTEDKNQDAGEVLELLNQIQNQQRGQNQNQNQRREQGNRNFPQRRFDAPTSGQSQKGENQSRQNLNQPRQQQGQNQNTNQQNQNLEEKPDLNNPPEDWLTPKVYKGSSNV